MKRFISIVISVVILLIIYSRIDLDGLIQVFQKSDPFWMIISIGMIIPLTLITSWRLQEMMPKVTNLKFFEANQLILGASVLNMVLPSKMGDIAKAYFIQKRGHLSGNLALSLVIFEKTVDLISLLLWCVFGLIVYPEKNSLFLVMTLGVALSLILSFLLIGSPKFAEYFLKLAIRFSPRKLAKKLRNFQESWGEMHGYFWSNQKQLVIIFLTSIFLWFLHLLQIWLFILALKASTPFLVNLALSPLAILAGLLPLGFAGIGTRDAALIIFYAPYFDSATGAALGLLCTSRYFLPALIGLPFLGKMMIAVRKIKQQ